MSTTIRYADFVDSIAGALQYISYYHPADYIQHLARAYEREQSAAAKDAIAQILTNSKMCAEGRRSPDTAMMAAAEEKATRPQEIRRVSYVVPAFRY